MTTTVYYYASVDDANSYGFPLGYNTNMIVGSGYEANSQFWYLTPNSEGLSPPGYYSNGDFLTESGNVTYRLGAVKMGYYSTLSDAITLSYPNSVGFSTTNTVGTYGGYSKWKIAPNSTGSSSKTAIYSTGNVLAAGGLYYLYPSPVVGYYPTLINATNDTSAIAYSLSSYTVGTYGGYSNWKIAPNSTGSSSQTAVYSTGNLLDASGLYYLYPSAPCFLEGTTVLCKVDDIETYIPVEQLKPGTLVKTSLNGYKPIILVGKESIQNPGHDERIEERLYKLTPSKYPQLKDDLYLTGGHSVLEFPLTEKQTQDTIRKLGDLYVTEKKYRLLACLDERAEPWASEGTYTIWAFALQHDDVGKNYGVYVNGGLLVESCSEHFLKINSNMELIAA